jgi:shikimate kinase
MNSPTHAQDKQNLIFLVGMMGTGKSTIGKELAEQRKVKFIDSDSEIEKNRGASVSQIFAKKGEAYFRDLERRFISSLSINEPAVVACGGGLCMPEGMMELLKSKGLVFCLMASVNTLLSRTKADQTRPLLQVPQPLLVLEKLMQEREPRYLEADHVIHTDDQTATEIVKKISEHLTA